MRQWRQVRRAASIGLAVLTLLTPTVARADAPVQRIIDVVAVTWAGAGTPSATAADVTRTITTDTIPRWTQISGGRVAFTLGAVLPTVTTNQPLPCDASGSLQFLSAVALAAYQQAGITDTSHRYLVELAANPPGGCIWDGRGVVEQPGATSGMLVLRDTADPTVIAHELGHNLGLGHSNLERCTGGRADGPWADCQAVEYGSATDLMGNTPRTSALSAYHQWRLGWLSDLDVAVGNRDETVTLHAVDAPTPPVDAEGHYVPLTRALFVRDGAAAYWVEFRRADVTNGIKQGLVIYRTDPPPASSVSSPIASDAADPTSMRITTDVWMINLGDWAYPDTTGSPSLAPDTTFTTAYGGATLSAHVNADGTATVTVRRAGPVTPGAPTWTDASTWRNADAAVTAATLDDGGLDIARFQAEITDASGTRVVSLPRADAALWERTYLTPVGMPAIVRLGELPEGVYTLRLRAVNVDGVAGAWSTSQRVHIDRGNPIVSSRMTIAGVSPGRTVSVAWTGATDAGSGICSAQALNPDGWALAGWHASTGGVPRFAISASASVAGDGQAFDCVGNGVEGSLAMTTSYVPAARWALAGSWRATKVAGGTATGATVLRGAVGAVGADSGGSAVAANGSASVPALRCAGTCSASITSGTGTSVVIVGAGAATVSVDGRIVRTLPAVRDAGSRVGAVVTGRHRIVVRGAGAVLVGMQQVALSWQQRGTVSGASHTADASLRDPAQAILSRIGFSQSDFADTMTVAPIGNGTTLKDATIDLCGGTFASEASRIARRQVAVVWPGESAYGFVSSETVRYRSPAAVRQALQELDTATSTCRARGYAIGSAGATTPYTFASLPALPEGLRPAVDRRLYLVTIGEGAQAATYLLVYQADGDMLNAMYVSAPGAGSLASDAVSRWLRVATTLGARLTDAVTRGLTAHIGAGAA